MKLYIPTSSLNFNDIFSTESISPKKFYSMRKFGTNRHFSTELNLFDEAITLYKEMPYFNLCEGEIGEYEEYPVVIQIDIDEMDRHMIKIDENIYAYNKTIYFDLQNVKVFFLKEQDMANILGKAQIVREVKTIEKYNKNFEVINVENLRKVSIENAYNKVVENTDIDQEILRDQNYNNIKGFYYCYFIKKFFISNICNLLQAIKEDKAILSDLTHILDMLLRKKSYLADYKRNSLKFHNSVMNREEKIIMDELLVSAGTAVAHIDILYEQIQGYLDYSRNKENTDEKISKFFNNFRKLVDDDLGFDVEKKYGRNYVKFNGNERDAGDERKLYEIIINCLIEHPKSKVGEIAKEEIESLLALIGKRIKEHYGEESAYLRQMREIYSYFKNNKFTMSINDIKSNTLKNLFAFILKFKSADNLERFLEDQHIDNSYIAFSFLGAFTGFAGIGKLTISEFFQVIDGRLVNIIDDKLKKFREIIWLGDLVPVDTDVLDLSNAKAGTCEDEDEKSSIAKTSLPTSGC